MADKICLRQLLDADWRRLVELGGADGRRPVSAFLHPRFASVWLFRHAAAAHFSGFRSLAKVLSFANFALFGCEIPSCLVIGPGLVMPHPNGVILGARSIGRNATIFQQVTLGAAEVDFHYQADLRPCVGDLVTIGSGARVIGSVRLGDGCTVGANAVVLEDVPAGALAVGVPARARTVEGTGGGGA